MNGFNVADFNAGLTTPARRSSWARRRASILLLDLFLSRRAAALDAVLLADAQPDR